MRTPTTNQATSSAAPMALYIHWPFCRSKCPYCDFNSHVRDSIDAQRWQNALLSELEHVASRLPGRKLRSIFFGGGTPSLMPPETAAALIDKACACWQREADLEVTLEANPTSVEYGLFAAFRAAGVNRVSLGVQSFDDKELAFLGRGHSSAEARRAIEQARDHFDRYSFDLIYARPGQTIESWRQELGDALALASGHLSLYQLTIEENTAFHHAYAKGAFRLPDDETSAELYQFTEDLLAAHGMPAYEVSNYAAHGQESRHNLAYWQGQDYAGIGPGAHGRLQVNGVRTATQCTKSPERWLEAVERQGNGLELWQALSAQEDMEEQLMMGMRLTRGIAYDDFAQRTGVSLQNHVGKHTLDSLVRHGLIEASETHLQATRKGRLLLNSLTAALLA